MSFEQDEFFENEVRRIARARWPDAQFDGAAIINGKERDGIFETDEVVHFIEATTSRRAEKARDDTKKIFGLMAEHQRSGSLKGAIGWFITRDEPTPDQREIVKTVGRNQIKAASFAQFQQAIIDVHKYFQNRENHLFGSILNPNDGSTRPPESYINIDLIELSTGVNLTITEICDKILTGESFLLLGDYGAGKSMSLRELYVRLKKSYLEGTSTNFPVYINLREHSGQDDPSELLERHARRIGFDKPHSLVAAWRAGFVIPLIDGFDEITSLGISKDKTKIKETRRRSLEAIRKLIEQTPASIGYIVAGREHFFSTPKERNSALGLREKTTPVVIGEMNKKQVNKYVESLAGGSLNIPSWLPTRPLLISYLVKHILIENDNQEANAMASAIDAIDGWNQLLNRIFIREAKISPNLDGDTLRAILERLATIARSTTDGLGPITPNQIRSAFIQICESEPDDQANLLLQRLPGLGVFRYEDDSRTFVDAELAGICSARDITDFLLNPYQTLQNSGWKNAMGSVSAFAGSAAIERTRRNIRSNEDRQFSIDAAFQSIKNMPEMEVLRSDLGVLCLEIPLETRRSTIIDNAILENYVVNQPENTDLSSITFRDCIFEGIYIGDEASAMRLPKFEGCLFLSAFGRTGINDLPSGKFDSRCTFEKFDASSATQSAILSTNLTRGERIVLTILRKVFVQSLSGRAESALLRGLDINDRALVGESIKLLQQESLLTSYNGGDGIVWIPNRKELTRVRRILAAPSTCNDSVLLNARALGT